MRGHGCSVVSWRGATALTTLDCMRLRFSTPEDLCAVRESLWSSCCFRTRGEVRRYNTVSTHRRGYRRLWRFCHRIYRSERPRDEGPHERPSCRSLKAVIASTSASLVLRSRAEERPGSDPRCVVGASSLRSSACPIIARHRSDASMPKLCREARLCRFVFRICARNQPRGDL